MTMESELKRIADALEAIAARAPVVNPNPPKAAVLEVVAAAVEPPAGKRGPGRPPKNQPPPAPPPPAPVSVTMEPDMLDTDAGDALDFLADDTVEEVTLEMVQAALKDCQKRHSHPELARKVLAEAGNGAQTLKALDKSLYAAVVKAANAA